MSVGVRIGQPPRSYRNAPRRCRCHSGNRSLTIPHQVDGSGEGFSPSNNRAAPSRGTKCSLVVEITVSPPGPAAAGFFPFRPSPR